MDGNLKRYIVQNALNNSFYKYITVLLIIGKHQFELVHGRASV